MMVRRAFVLLFLAVLGHITILSLTAAADDTGFASIHEWCRERGKTCMVDHFHTGNGTGRTKKAARRAAIIGWKDFAAWEYGTDWARFRSAGSTGVAYTRPADGWRESFASCSMSWRVDRQPKISICDDAD